jgi:hypothetical protein
MPSFRAFSTKHSHLFIFFGALIVFFTFVIKEGLTERWRNDAEKIDTSQREYRLRVEVKNISDSVNDIQRTLASMEEKKKGRQPRESEDYLFAKERIKEIEAQIDHLYEQLDHINILARALPAKDPHGQEAEKVQDQLKTFTQQALDIKFGLSMSPDDIGTDYTVWEKRTADKSNALEAEMMSNLNDFGRKLDKLDNAIFDDARMRRRRHEEYADIGWWISAFLFALGWGLGLLGKLHGVPAAAGDE